MAAFTEITTETKYLSRDIVNELVLAYSERRQCAGDSAVAGVAVGYNLQTLSFWREIQDWVESKCTRWVDDSSFSTATEYDAPSDIAHTLATFRSEAGLNANGFRRATEWPGTFSYGKMQAGDIIGPWIVEDLQKALDAMRWTYTYDVAGLFQSPGPITASLSGSEARLGESSLLDTAQEAYDAAVGDYSLVMERYDPYTVTYVMRLGAVSNKYSCDLYRQSADVIYADIPQHVTHEADAFYWVEGDEFFFDFDSLGILAKRIFVTQSFASASVGTRTQSKVAGTATPPDQYGIETRSLGTSRGSWGMILKWEFTNTL